MNPPEAYDRHVATHEVNVAIALVTVRTDSEDRPLLQGLQRHGTWPTATVPGGKAPAEVASDLANRLNPLPSANAIRWCSTPEEVGFSADQEQITLIYSAVVPMWWAEAQVDAAIRSEVVGFDLSGMGWEALRRTPPARGPRPAGVSRNSP